jgi:hypothetical protein
MVSIFKRILKLPAEAWQHWIGVVGILAATVFGILMAGLYLVELVGFAPGPYSGIFTFMLVPGAFVLSLLLIPLGGWLARRRKRKGAPGEIPRLPIIDLNNRSTMQWVMTVAGLTVVNILLVGTATYKGIYYMDSVSFCGKICHSVMDPEYTAYERSPHSRVKCVDCHIGPGAPWFVKSKISGTYQVISVIFNLYPRPIATPIKDLRPARETCEQCHWPAKFQGKQVRVRNRYETDEKNTRLTNVLVMNIGGINPKAGEYEGIHWHVSPHIRIQYYAADRTRMEIPYVEVERAGETKRVFRSSPKFEPPQGAELRIMDCIDCHNRPTHIFDDPGRAVDAALDAGKIPVALPCAKAAVLDAIKKSYPSRPDAAGGIDDALREFYKTKCTDAKEEVTPERLRAASAAALAIYRENVFPSMKIGWDTYPNNIGHHLFKGCFRCHDDQHENEKGEVIPQDCDLCHTIVAMDEPNPAILQQLNLGE